jgi:hypothetical protein
MIWYGKEYKKISKEEYKRLTKDLSNLELLLTDRVYKKLKSELAPKISEGIGIVEYIRQQENLSEVEYTEDDYDYFLSDGYTLNIMGSAKTIETFERMLNKK